MKKLLILAFLIISMITNAQIKFIDKEYFTASIAIDPNATIKDGINITPELELISYWKYVKVNSQIQPDLLGGYFDIAGTFGINLTEGRFNQWRAYSGLRLGHIWRASYGYPLVGFEGGIDYNINDKLFIGVRSTGDYRSDFKYSGAEPSMRYSGTIRIGTKW
jgi:hypothetical protein